MSQENLTKLPPWIFQGEASFRPIGRKIMCAVEPRVETTKSGIIMPERDRTAPLVAVVLAVGEDAGDRPGSLVMAAQRLLDSLAEYENDIDKDEIEAELQFARGRRPLKVGDRVIFERYSGTPVQAGSKPAVLFLDPEDVLCVVLPAKPEEAKHGYGDVVDAEVGDEL